MGKHVHVLSEVSSEERTATCANCGPVKIVSSGWKGNKQQWTCKERKRENAKSERRQEWYKDWQKDYYRRTGGAHQHANWIRQYGLTPEDYQLLMDQQDGKCAICRETCSSGNRLSVDHDHETNQVRGLLCRSCNRGLGLLKDNPLVLMRAWEYLKLRKNT